MKYIITWCICIACKCDETDIDRRIFYDRKECIEYYNGMLISQNKKEINTLKMDSIKYK